jgi:hypothetical protein
MKLMYDNTDVSFEQELSEGVEKKYRIKGIFSTPEKQNKNGRVYPKSVWEREVDKYQDILKTGHPNCLMELDHPPRSNVDMMEAVAKMEKLYFENGYVMGEAVLLDNPKANQLKTLIDNGIKMSVSSRGVGSVKGNVVDNYNLITFDIIPNLGQSNYESEMYGIVEGVLQDKNFLITESGEIKEVEIKQEQDNLNEAINAKNWSNIKEFMKKQPGFSSWEFEGDYETLIVSYKTPKQAAQAFTNSNKSSNELMSYGDDFWVQGKKIYVVLSDEAKKALDVNENIKSELTEFEKKIAVDKFMKNFREILGKSIVNEGIKVNSPIACVQVIQMAMKKITDEKTKDLLQSAIDFLVKEFKINLN